MLGKIKLNNLRMRGRNSRLGAAGQAGCNGVGRVTYGLATGRDKR